MDCLLRVTISFLCVARIATTSAAAPDRQIKGSELVEFRRELNGLSYEITTRPWDDRHDDAIASIIASKIQPSLKKLRDALSSLKSEPGITLIEKPFTTAPLPLLLLLSIVPGFPTSSSG
jgi:hypothetical protein